MVVGYVAEVALVLGVGLFDAVHDVPVGWGCEYEVDGWDGVVVDVAAVVVVGDGLGRVEGRLFGSDALGGGFVPVGREFESDGVPSASHGGEQGAARAHHGVENPCVG